MRQFKLTHLPVIKGQLYNNEIRSWESLTERLNFTWTSDAQAYSRHKRDINQSEATRHEGEVVGKSCRRNRELHIFLRRVLLYLSLSRMSLSIWVRVSGSSAPPSVKMLTTWVTYRLYSLPLTHFTSGVLKNYISLIMFLSPKF